MQPCVERVGEQSGEPFGGISVRVLALEVPQSIKYKRPSISTQSSSFSSSIQTPPTTLVLLFTSVVRHSFDIWLASLLFVCAFVQLNHYTNTNTLQARPFLSRQQCSIEVVTASYYHVHRFPSHYRQHEHARVPELDHQSSQPSDQSVSHRHRHVEHHFIVDTNTSLDTSK